MEYEQTTEADLPSGAKLKALDKKQVLKDLYQKLLEITEEK